LLEDGLGQAKRSQQFPRGDVANAWRQGQEQSGGKRLTFHSTRRNQLGLTRWSPTFTPLVMSRISP
jgi:hypothetical protein